MSPSVQWSNDSAYLLRLLQELNEVACGEHLAQYLVQIGPQILLLRESSVRTEPGSRQERCAALEVPRPPACLGLLRKGIASLTRCSYRALYPHPRPQSPFLRAQTSGQDPREEEDTNSKSTLSPPFFTAPVVKEALDAGGSLVRWAGRDDHRHSTWTEAGASERFSHLPGVTQLLGSRGGNQTPACGLPVQCSFN